MEIKDKFTSFTSSLRSNWAIIIAVVVGIYTGGQLKADFETEKVKRIQIEERLDKKIQVIYQNLRSISDLEKDLLIRKEGEKLVLYRINELEKKLKNEKNK